MSTIILAHDHFLDGHAKTAEALLRYGQDPVTAVIDRESTGQTVADVLPDAPRDVPVVPSIEDALASRPSRLVIGVAPVGGLLPADWREDVEAALEAGVDVVSGMHELLAEDPVFAKLAQQSGASITDVRKPPGGKPIYSAEILDLDALVVLTAGTDCSSGKMTTSVELVQALRERGIETAFAATGQTGLMIGADAGVVVDAVPADFIAGWTERITLEARRARDAEIVVVEGQGALTHPAYAAVSLGLLHGASPHACILCHDAKRKHKTASFHGGRRFPVLAPSREWDLVQALARPLRTPTLLALSIMNGPQAEPDQDGPLAGVPSVDVLDGGADRLADAVEALR